MFNNKKYLEVNREERFFCFILAHAFLTSEKFRKGFLELIQSKFGLCLNPRSLEIYLEVTLLRDYWYDLGDPREYSDETHQARESVIKAILKYCLKNCPENCLKNVDKQELAINEYDFFWSTKERERLWSPGRWDLKKMEEAGLEKLKCIKWAFNCKPDILICSEDTFLLIEAKLESSEGRSAGGYEQFKTLKKLTELIKLLVPFYSDYNDMSIVLAHNNGRDNDNDNDINYITWAEIYNIAKNVEFDGFIKESFLQLERFSRGK